MEKLSSCPICGKELKSGFCRCCGYDEGGDFLKSRTLAPVSEIAAMERDFCFARQKKQESIRLEAENRVKNQLAELLSRRLAEQKAETVASGRAGEDLTWSLDSAGTLTISGRGAMKDFTDRSSVPWKRYVRQIERVMLRHGVETIGEGAFYDCDALRFVHLPQSLRRIGSYAFQYCGSLRSASIPNGVETIGEGAFFDCFALAELTLPTGLRSIGDTAFGNCAALRSVELPDGLESIGSYAFSDCRSLRSIRLPRSVTEIGAGAFYNCDALKEVRYRGTEAAYRAGARGWNRLLNNCLFDAAWRCEG